MGKRLEGFGEVRIIDETSSFGHIDSVPDRVDCGHE